MTVNPYFQLADNMARMRDNAEGPFVDARECVVCDQPTVERGGVYVHVLTVNGDHAADHRAQPKLAHPMDSDPFAGIE